MKEIGESEVFIEKWKSVIFLVKNKTKNLCLSGSAKVYLKEIQKEGLSFSNNFKGDTSLIEPFQ